MAHPFEDALWEYHHGLDLSEAGGDTQRELIDRLKLVSSWGVNGVNLGEAWPRGLSALVTYEKTFPELAPHIDRADAHERRNNLQPILDRARSLKMSVLSVLNIQTYPPALTELFPECIAVAPPAADRWYRTTTGGLSRQPQLCPSSEPARWLLTAQLEEICAIDGIAGVSCWLNAADSDLFFCNCDRCREKKVPDVIADFANLAYPVCEKHGKRLIIRTYLGGWRSGLETETALALLGRIPEGVELLYKQQVGDMYEQHPLNPLIGQLSPHKQLVEVDTYGEYRGSTIGIVVSVRHRIAEALRSSAEAGVRGAVVRGLHHLTPFSIDGQIFGALAADPNLDVDRWSACWAQEQFGEAGDDVLRVLDESAGAAALAMYVRGVNWASWSIPQTLARLRFILFDRSAPCVRGSERLLAPTPETIELVDQEHARALERAREALRVAESLEGRLEPTAHAQLLGSCRVLVHYCELVRPLMQSVMRFLCWEKHSSEVAREYVRVPLGRDLDAAQQILDRVRKAFEQIDVTTAGIELTGNQSPLMTPCDNAQRVIDDIRAEIDHEPSSLWSVYPWPDRWPKQSRGGWAWARP